MDKTSSGYIMLFAGIALVLGGGYVFTNLEGGGVNPRTVGSFSAILAGVVLFVWGKSRAAAGEHEGLAGEAGLQVTGALGLAGSERVEMEGEFEGFRVSVSKRETSTHSRAGYSRRVTENYVFTLELPNPAGLSFYIGTDSLLAAPIGFVPEKLDASAWEWADMLAVRGEPPQAAEALFGNKAAWPLFRDFFGKVSCRLKDGAMEFYPDTEAMRIEDPRGVLSAADIKGLIGQAVEVAKLVRALPPAGNYPA